MSFHEVRFPTDLSFGAAGGPERRTEIVALTSGHEERNSPWEHARRRYDAGMGLRSLDDIEVLIAFFEARRGELYGFRWKDWTDFKSSRPSAATDALDQPLGEGDAATRVWQLRKLYRSGGTVYARPVTKPVAGTVSVAVEGDRLVEGEGFEVDPATGRVTLATPPGLGDRVTAGFEFDVPVRFAAAAIETSVATFEAGEVPSVPVIEVRI